ncbi:MAG: sensor domain-containing diguanylate cyclase [Pararhodobacter sp.]|nr:sensor domain-containing diguanylate cyclase [Pararhodobacter sp.]
MTFLSTFKPDDEAGRLAAVERYQIIDTPPEAEFQEIISLIRAVLQVQYVAVSLITSDRQWFKAQLGLDIQETPRDVAFCDHTIRSEAALKISDATRDPRFADNPSVTGDPGIRSYLGVPLRSPDGYNIGALCVMGTEPREYSKAEEDVLRNFSKLIMSQLELRLLSRRDGLTGTLTRRAFEERMRMSFEERAEIQMSLLLLDIDHFKQINDLFGHPVGDAALITVASTLTQGLRRTDMIGRYGGEEFAILLQDITPQDAEALAERLRAAIAAAQIAAIAPRRITVSLGIAHRTRDIRSIEDWMLAADAALYEAKHKGRNRAVVAA